MLQHIIISNILNPVHLETWSFSSRWFMAILRTVFGTEAETRILSLAFAPLKRLKPVFCRWQFKTVRTVVIAKLKVKAI